MSNIEICKGWSIEPLKNIAYVSMGISPPSSTYNKQQIGLPFFQGKAEFGATFPSVKKYCSSPLKIAEKLDILMSVRAPVGPVNLNPTRSCIGRGLSAIRAREERVDQLYLFYYFRSIQGDLARSGQGSTFKAINKTDLENIKVPIPKSIKAQQKIVTVLKRADEVRQKREQINQVADEILRAVFLEMFGNPETNPMSWEERKFENLLTDMGYGTSVKCNSENKGIPILRIPNIINGRIEYNNLKFAPLQQEHQLEKLILLEGDILFVRTNGNRDYVGRSAVFHETNKKFAFASYLIRARLSQGIDPDFANTYLSLPYARKQLFQNSRTSAGQYNINTKGLKAVKFFVPPLNLQRKFVSVKNRIRYLSEKQQQSTRDINELFNSLIFKAFRGELFS